MMVRPDWSLGRICVMFLNTRCVAIRDHSFLLVSSHNTKGKWVLPKGGWEVDETAEEAATRETFEEAGVVVVGWI